MADIIPFCVDCKHYHKTDHGELKCRRDAINPVTGEPVEYSPYCENERAYVRIPESFTYIPCCRRGTFWEAK